jgi:hypothetical protein
MPELNEDQAACAVNGFCDATQVMPSILAEWRPARQLAIHSDFTLDRSIGGTRKAEFLEYMNAVLWRWSNHLFPVFELVGSRNGFTGQTQLVALPEIILRAGPHLDVKVGLQLGLTAVTPAVGLRFELAATWGRRRQGASLLKNGPTPERDRAKGRNVTLSCAEALCISTDP